jgi:hypothetical protein
MMPPPIGWMRWPFMGLTASLLVGGVGTGLLFWIATDSLVPLIVGYALLVLCQLRPFPMMFGDENATEFVLFLGYDRRRLAARYLIEVLLHSVAHALGIFAVWRLAGSPDIFGLSGLGLAWRVLAALVSLQLLVRSTWQGFMTLPFATCLPARVRDHWLGNAHAPLLLLCSPLVAIFLSFLVVTAIFSAGILVVTVPLSVLSFLGLAILVRSTEFSGSVRAPARESSSRTTWTKPRLAPVVAIFWTGLSRWVWASLILLLVPAGVAAAAQVFWPGRIVEIESPVLLLGLVGLEAWTILLMWFGGKIYRWSAAGPSAEFLHMAGLSVPGLRRIKLATGGLVMLLAIALVILGIPALDQANVAAYIFNSFLRGSISLLLLAGAAQALLRMNECPLAVRRDSMVTGDDLAWIAWAGMCLMLIATFLVERLGGVDLRKQAFPWTFAGGMLLFAPAFALWIVGWFRASDETAGRG